MEDIGDRLRAVRKEAKLSQRELAKRAGVTNSTISMIEKNKVSPSVGSLKKVLSGIPMSLLEFFVTEEEQAAPPVVYRAHELSTIEAESGINWKLYGRGYPGRKMAVMEETYPPGADTGKESFQHEGEEAGVIIAGQLEITVDGTAHVLAKGDGYYFDTRRPHRFRNPFDQDCVLISSLTPPKL